MAPVDGLFTSESGGQAMFQVSLAVEPAADLTIPLSSSDDGEGTPSLTALTFTSDNWNVLQTVTVTGVDDLEFDGPEGYSIITGPAISGDGRFAGYDADDVQLVNYDNDFAALAATQPAGSLIYQTVLVGVLRARASLTTTTSLSIPDRQ